MTNQKERRKLRALFQLAESSPETEAIREALANPSVGAALEKMTGDGLARMHHREVAAFRQRELNAFWSKENAKAERKQKLSVTSTNTISEQELLKIVGRGGESQQANSAWILRRIEAAKSDSMVFPPFVQIGRHRRYHVDSVKAWLSNSELLE